MTPPNFHELVTGRRKIASGDLDLFPALRRDPGSDRDLIVRALPGSRRVREWP